MVPYKVDIGNDRSIMCLHIYKRVLPSATVDDLAAVKGAKIKLRIYNHTSIRQFGRCKVKIENNNKMYFLCSSWRQRGIVGMPDIELLNIVNINCNTIGAEKDEKGTNCNANKDSTIDSGSEQCCPNTSPERSCTKTNSNADSYINIGSN